MYLMHIFFSYQDSRRKSSIIITSHTERVRERNLEIIMIIEAFDSLYVLMKALCVCVCCAQTSPTEKSHRKKKNSNMPAAKPIFALA